MTAWEAPIVAISLLQCRPNRVQPAMSWPDMSGCTSQRKK